MEQDQTKKTKFFPESLVLAIRPNSQNDNVGKASTSTQRQVAIIAALVSESEGGGGGATTGGIRT